MLHYSQHFQCKKPCDSNNNDKYSQSSPNNLNNDKKSRNRRLSMKFADFRHHLDSTAFVRTFKSPKKCCKRCNCFSSIDDEEFDLFPISFLFYLIFILITSTLVLIKEFYAEYAVDDDSNDHSLYNTLHYVSNPLYIAINNKHEFEWNKTTQIHTENDSYSYIMDWMICYFILILSILESLFNFYRYFTTKHTSKHFFTAEPIQVFKYFIVYIIIFSIFFILQIHCYYWLFPFVACIHCTFNIYCTWTFCSILIERYSFYAEVEQALRHIHEALLETVYIIRRSSIISALFSSLYVLLFSMTYDVHIVIYIPLLWSISNICFMFNFVRNRVWIQRKIFHCKECIHFIQNEPKNQNKTTLIISPSPSRKRPQLKVTKSDLHHINTNNNNEHLESIKDLKTRPTLSPNNTSNNASSNNPSSNITPNTATPMTDNTPNSNNISPPTTDPIFAGKILLSTPNENHSENDLTPNTSTPIYSMPMMKRTTNQQSISKGLLCGDGDNINSVPTPISTHNELPSEEEKKTPFTDNDNNDNNDCDSEWYQKWYSNQHKSPTPSPKPYIRSQTSLSIPVPTIQTNLKRISLSHRSKTASKTASKTGSKRKFKAFDVFGIDTTPLTECKKPVTFTNQGQDITHCGKMSTSLYSAYDMTPINMKNISIPMTTIESNKNYKIDDDMEMSDDSEDEPSVQMLSKTDIQNIHKSDSQTPISGLFMGMISTLKKASSLVKSNSNDSNKQRKYQRNIPFLKGRARSFSDPTNIKPQIHSFNNDENDEKYDKNELAKDSLVLDMNKTSNRSNKSAPTMNVNTYQYNVQHFNMKSHSFQAKLLEGDDDDDDDDDDDNKYPQYDNELKPKLIITHSEPKPNRSTDIVGFVPTTISRADGNNTNISYDAEVLLSVLVSHGFCSRKSLNNAKQLRSYINIKIQDK